MQKIIREINVDDFNKQLSYRKYNECFTINEIEKFGRKNNKASLSARYLIKEIIIEWLGDALKPVDMEILNNEYGRPQLFSKKISEDIQKKIHFSVSHTKRVATALVIFDLSER